MENCIEWTGAKDGKGYGKVIVKGRSVGAHRIAYCEANGVGLEDIVGLCVRHKCDNPPCVSPEHLELGTHADNMRDRSERGRTRSAVGSSHPNSKLQEEEVLALRGMYEIGYTISDLSRIFEISRRMVKKIIDRQSWKHVEG